MAAVLSTTTLIKVKDDGTLEPCPHLANSLIASLVGIYGIDVLRWGGWFTAQYPSVILS